VRRRRARAGDLARVEGARGARNQALYRPRETCGRGRPRNRQKEITMRMARIVGFWCLAAVVLASVPVSGQGATATMLGTATDESGLPLPGATITAVNTQTGFTRETVTSDTGAYRLAALPPGTYDVTATMTGFAQQKRTGVTLVVLQELTYDIRMTLATLEETITVAGAAPLVEVSKSEVSGAVVQEQIMALPVSSRQFTDLALLLPGANADQRREWSDPVNIGAGSWHQTSFVMDGANNVWAATGESRMNFTQDAVREFKVITAGFKAEYGNSATGVVVGVSKSGTNQFRGSGFEFFRHENLNAKAAFEVEKQPYRRHQFGFTFGGPIKRDRAFFFAAVERLDEKSSINVAAGGRYPRLEGQHPQPITQTLGTFKLDAQVTSNHSAFVRWATQRKNWSNQGVGGNNHPTATRDLDFPRDSVVGGFTSVLGSAVNDFRVEWAFTRAVKSPVFEQGLGYRFPSINYGNIPGWEFEWEKRLEVVNDFLFHKSGWLGEHDLKTGASFNPYVPLIARWWGCEVGCYRLGVDVAGFPDTPVNFAALGAASQILQLQIGQEPTGPEVNYPMYGFYFQDDWKPASRVTMNLGVRWDAQWNTMVNEIGGEPFLGDLLIPGVYDRRTRERDLNNWAPRGGLAYDLLGDGKMILRANTGLFYSMVPNLPIYVEARDRDGQNSTTVIINNPRLTNWEDPLAEIGDPTRFLAARRNISVVVNDLQNPSAFQAGIGFSRQLTDGMAIDVDVVRIEGENEFRSRNLNVPNAVTGQQLTSAYGVITQYETTGRSLYKALMMKVEKRMTNNLQFMASYTLAKGDNTVSSMWDGAADSNRLDDEYGPSTSDRRHRFVFSGITTALPFGLQLSGVLSLGTSRPFDVRAGTDINSDGDFGDRPPGVTRNEGCRDLSLDAVNAYRGSRGLPAVSSVECPGRYTLDTRLGKTFRLVGDHRLELFFEVFNVFNAQNLEHSQSQAIQSWTAIASNFGQAIIAGTPRQAALAARYMF
jgi:hypothetical protein